MRTLTRYFMIDKYFNEDFQTAKEKQGKDFGGPGPSEKKRQQLRKKRKK